MNLRCYCCGETIEFRLVALVSLSEDEVDRVFVMKPSHTDRVEDAKVEVVERESRA